jgi:exopolysaccharide production protein ExoQ
MDFSSVTVAAPGFARSPFDAAAVPRRLPLGLSLPVEDLACVAIIAFFAVQGAIPGIAPVQAHEITGTARSTYTTIGGVSTQLAINTVILLLLLRHPRLLLRNLLTVPWAAMLGILAIASTAWSLDPLLTLRRSLPFAFAGLFGLWFAVRFSPRRQLCILRLAMLALALCTIGVVVFMPSIGLDHSPGHPADWQGVFTQKNACGRVMVLATCVILFGGRLTVRRLGTLGLFLFVLVMSGSRGAWMIEVAILVLWSVLRLARRSSPRLRTVIAAALPPGLVLVAAAAASAFHHLLILLGRDPTLSGRTAIWQQVLPFMLGRPWLGYGYNAFWRGAQGPSLQIDSSVHFIVEHAHNGFFEICLEIGIAGLALSTVAWLNGLRRLLPLWRRGDIESVAFPLAVLVLVALYDLDENTLLIFNGLFWPLFVAGLAQIECANRDARHREPGALRATLMDQQDPASGSAEASL